MFAEMTLKGGAAAKRTADMASRGASSVSIAQKAGKTKKPAAGEILA
jgi:hypothetical protein